MAESGGLPAHQLVQWDPEQCSSFHGSCFPLLRPYLPNLIRAQISSAGDRGHDQDLIAVAELIGIATQEAHVLIVHVDIDEAPYLATFVAQVLGDCRVLGPKTLEYPGQIRALALNPPRSVGEPPQRARYFHCYFHRYPLLHCAILRGDTVSAVAKEPTPSGASAPETEITPARQRPLPSKPQTPPVSAQSRHLQRPHRRARPKSSAHSR